MTEFEIKQSGERSGGYVTPGELKTHEELPVDEFSDPISFPLQTENAEPDRQEPDPPPGDSTAPKNADSVAVEESNGLDNGESSEKKEEARVCREDVQDSVKFQNEISENKNASLNEAEKPLEEIKAGVDDFEKHREGKDDNDSIEGSEKNEEAGVCKGVQDSVKFENEILENKNTSVNEAENPSEAVSDIKVEEIKAGKEGFEKHREGRDDNDSIEGSEKNEEAGVCKSVQDSVKFENEILENKNASVNEAENPSEALSDIKVEEIKAGKEGFEKHREDRDDNGSVEGSEVAGVVSAVENGVGREETEKEEEEEEVHEETELMDIPQHWYPKPCVRVIVVGGSVTEEELLSLFNAHGSVSSVAFENEKRDAAIIRFNSSPGDELLVAKIREKINNTQLGVQTLRVEVFRIDSFLFIGNLTPDTDDRRLKDMFEPHGTVERAFVLRNLAGRTKGYGFVEYRLKYQAVAAKTSMNSVIMDGRILRVEWTDCKGIKDLFSSILFVDRITKHMSNAEVSLKTLFGQYAKVKDIHLAIGMGGVSRGFAFVDFSNSAGADKAREALDGREFGGLNLRVSFANPSKSAQSYKQRYSGQDMAPVFGAMGRRPVSGFQAPTGNSYLPYGGNQLQGARRSGVLGMGLEMQYNRGALFAPRAHGQIVIGRGSGMFGPVVPRMGVMGRPPISDTNIHRRPGVPVGAQSIISGIIGQVAAPQVKAYEDEGRRREDYYRHASADQMAFDQSKIPQSQHPYRKPYHQQHQQHQQHSYQHQQTVQKQPYHQFPQTRQQQNQQSSTLQSQYQSTQQNSQHYARPAERYPQLQQHQPSHQSYSSYPRYSQQFNKSYTQIATQQYSQPSTQQTQSEVPHSQPIYSDPQYVPNQPQHLCSEGIPPTTPVGTYPSVSQDRTQLQAYDSYYQQQSGHVSGGLQAVGTQFQVQDAQWAAYYASQATYQQQAPSYNQTQQQQPPPTSMPIYPEKSVMISGALPVSGGVDVGQKWTSDQVDIHQQGQQQTPYAGYLSNYQQPASYQSSTYQQAAPSNSHPVASTYPLQPQEPTYQTLVYADGYYQQQQHQSGFPPASAQVFDNSKRPRF